MIQGLGLGSRVPKKSLDCDNPPIYPLPPNQKSTPRSAWEGKREALLFPDEDEETIGLSNPESREAPQRGTRNLKAHGMPSEDLKKSRISVRLRTP